VDSVWKVKSLTALILLSVINSHAFTVSCLSGQPDLKENPTGNARAVTLNESYRLVFRD